MTVKFATTLKGLDEMIEHMSDGALYYLDRIWVPLKGDVKTLIMNKAYKSKYSVYPRADKMYYDLRDRYWWPRMKKDTTVYEGIAMDFVTKLLRTSSRHDTIWVIMDRLTKSAHFVPMREDYKMDRLARLYLNEIVARHDVLISIISDHDSRFTSRFWHSMEEAFRTRLDMSTAYHPQSDVEFLYNNSYRSSVRCVAFKDLYGRKCRSSIMWVEVGEGQLIGPELVQETTKKISQIKDKLKATRDRQKSYADKRMKPLKFSIEILEIEFKKVKRSRIAIVKVRWSSKRGPEFTWERKDQMRLKSCSDVVAFACVILSLLLEVALCKCSSTGRLLGAYNIGVATPRALVCAGLMTSGDARSWYMISGDAKSWV
ncbi:putative reverse transcriptase domain-containing protein [Tanacetum coccineum]